MSTNIGDAFRETLYLYRLSGAELARKSGLTDAQISAFKNNRKELRTGSFSSLVNALPEDARQHFVQSAFGLQSGKSS